MLLVKSVLRPVGSLLLAAPLARAFILPLPTRTSCAPMTTDSTADSGSAVSLAAVSSLPRLLDTQGQELSTEQSAAMLKGKRVAYYFAAGWCPMVRAFDPSLLQFRQTAADAGQELALIYVPSDRSTESAVERAQTLQMLSVPFGDEADQIKKDYQIWAGSESGKLGTGRRSGVPALVVLDGEKGKEMAFVPAEAQGADSLKDWPLDDEKGVW